MSLQSCALRVGKDGQGKESYSREETEREREREKKDGEREKINNSLGVLFYTAGAAAGHRNGCVIYDTPSHTYTHIYTHTHTLSLFLRFHRCISTFHLPPPPSSSFFFPSTSEGVVPVDQGTELKETAPESTAPAPQPGLEWVALTRIFSGTVTAGQQVLKGFPL